MISRQKLIEEMKRKCVGNCLKCEHFTILSSDYHCGLIDDQPPADNWIPCSSGRLPETEEEVWVILGYTYESDYTLKSVARYIRFENGEAHWHDNQHGYLEWDRYPNGMGGCSLYKVIAWMPAEPYKGE